MAGHVGIQTNTPSGNQTFLESDVVLAVGVRFNDRHTGDLRVYTGNRKFIHIDSDPGQLGKILMPELGICADAKEALVAILSEVHSRGSARSANPWAKRVPELRAQLARKVDYDDVPIKAPRVFKELNEFFDEDTIFVTCIGLNQIWSGQLHRFPSPDTTSIAVAPVHWAGIYPQPSE